MVIFVFYEVIERAVNGIILAGFDLDRNGGEAVVIVDQIVHLAFAAVIIVKQLMTVRCKLTRHSTLIDRAEIDASFVIQNGADIVSV